MVGGGGGGIGFRLGSGREVVSIWVGFGSVCVKMGWCFRLGSCWVVFGWICGGVLDWDIVKNHHTLLFIQQEHILYPLTISKKTYVSNLHYPSSILCRKGTQCATW